MSAALSPLAQQLARSLRVSSVDLDRLDKLHPRLDLDAAVGELLRARVAEVRPIRDGRVLLSLSWESR